MNQAKREVVGFTELLYRFERTRFVLGGSQRTFVSYSRNGAAMALHFGKIPTELDPEQVRDYLFYLQKKLKSPCFLTESTQNKPKIVFRSFNKYLKTEKPTVFRMTCEKKIHKNYLNPIVRLPMLLSTTN